MRNPRHVALALTVVVIWGVNFVVIGVALEGFPPLLLATLRFVLTGLAAVLVPRPRVPWRWIAAVGLCTLAGQYGFLFVAMAQGLPEGLSSLVLQAQVPFTVLFAAVLLREHTTPRQLVGIAVAAAGLVAIGIGRGGSVTLGALLLCVASGGAWACGNICTKKAAADNGFALLVWASLFAVPPLAGLSLAMEGPHRIAASLSHLKAAPVAALLFVVIVSTLFGMGSWVMLMSKNPASAVVPYALGVPAVGLVAAAVLHGEHASAVELAGAAVVLFGLLGIVWNRTPDAHGARKAAKASVLAAKVREAREVQEARST